MDDELFAVEEKIKAPFWEKMFFILFFFIIRWFKLKKFKDT